jgi:choice-of-anchor C domain-containing protein
VAVAVGAVLALAVGAAQASAAPFSDGSFETPVAPVGGFIGNANPIGPWTVTAGSVDLIGSGFWQAADGVQSVDLDGSTPGTLCQTYDSATPGNGQVTFSEAHNPGAASGSLIVTVNGTQVGGTFTHNVASTTTNMNWQPHTVAFTVTGATTTLCFQSTTGTSAGPALDAVALTATADLSLTKTAAPTTVLHGNNVVYTLTESNAGPNTALAPTITDTLPAGQSFVSSDAGCTAALQVVTCNTADLPSGSSDTIHITASTAPTASPLYAPVMQTNSATVSSTTPDPGPGANTATAVVTVVPAADLTLSKSGSPNPVIGGQQLVYTLTGTNNGPDPAVAPTITDTLPAGETFDPETSSPGCTAAGQVVTCPVGPLSAPNPPGYINSGASYTVTIGADPTNTTGADTTDTNTATISSTTADPNTANNTATAMVTVSTSCTITKTGRITGSIDVEAGQFLCLNNATVTGSIQVDPGGALTSNNTRVNGAIQSNGAQFITICGTTQQAGSGFILKNTTLLTLVGDDDSNCAGNTLSGSLTVSGSSGGIEVFGNTIAGTTTLQNNVATSPIGDGTPEVEGNRIGGALNCKGNTPAPVNDGSTNTVTGAKLGQCTAL